ncbi:MAG: DUF1553 domain-containing protein [Verrucomicrobiota bacterium]
MPGSIFKFCLSVILIISCFAFCSSSKATPANKRALANYFGPFLDTRLNACTTCHLPSTLKAPENLDEFPHNKFGDRLRRLGEELDSAGKEKDIATRLTIVSTEDSDGDGVNNLAELLLKHAPGDAKDKPDAKELSELSKSKSDFQKFLNAYKWKPFESVTRPEIPKVKNSKWVRNPIDAFVAEQHESRKLKPRPEASKEILLRRVYLDLIGLVPTPDEMQAFLKDHSRDAYEKIVERLLADPRYGERWGRHWMDVWRYADWAGYNNEVRDSKPHIWHWRDWIVESLNKDKSYDRMVQEMLAADEMAPEDSDALRATGYLVRNWKLLSREAWMEDTMNHTSRAFLGVSMHCAKCHNHMYDPIQQKEYYNMRAIFEPYEVRTDRLPTEPDIKKDGLVRVFDTNRTTTTQFYIRGDERNPDTNIVIAPGVPKFLGGTFHVELVQLPLLAYRPDRRDFNITNTIASVEKGVAEAKAALEKLKTSKETKPEQIVESEKQLNFAEAKKESVMSTIRAEELEEKRDSAEWKDAAMKACSAQRTFAVLETKEKLETSRKEQSEAQVKVDEAAKKTNTKVTAEIAANKDLLDRAMMVFNTAKTNFGATEKLFLEAEMDLTKPVSASYKSRQLENYPATSTGRRSAFAKWVTEKSNPLTARVAMNHIWLRHLGQAIVPSVDEFGGNGRPPSNPELLDWLASEFMAQNWSMKKMHRLMVTSSAYRMSSSFDATNARLDQDNIYLWRMNPQRMEAEVVRDNLLYVSGQMDSKMGGPEIPATKALTSKRRSIYIQNAAEKESEFLQIFNGPSVTECYERKPSVMPQQALALANSELSFAQAKILAVDLGKEKSEVFIQKSFQRILNRIPKASELKLCREFLQKQTERIEMEKKPVIEKPVAPDSKSAPIKPNPVLSAQQRARQNLILILFNHTDFVTIR